MHCQICKAENPEDATVCIACGSTPTLAPGATVSGGAVPMGPAKLAGQVVAGRYEVKSILGKGGMGVVYRAFDRMLNEDVAIKLLHGTALGDSGDVDRLKREILTARRITHPNVIRIHDMGVDGEDGFLAMEILTGGALNRRLTTSPPSTAEAVQIAIGISDGLAAAHAKGIIHRDLKPHNVLFDADGTPKLVDFGLARVAEATSHTMGFSGTPLYMSPEMTDGREITTRSDVYSLGVVLYELFCGRTPFRADTLLRLAMMHARETPPRPTSVKADLPDGLEQILLKCLEKDPEHRFANGKEVADALRAFQAGHPMTFTLRLPEAVGELPAAPSRPRPKKRLTAAQRFAAIAGPAAMGLAVLVMLPSMRRHASSPAPVTDGRLFGESVAASAPDAQPAPPKDPASLSDDKRENSAATGRDEPTSRSTVADAHVTTRGTPHPTPRPARTPVTEPTKLVMLVATPAPTAPAGATAGQGLLRLKLKTPFYADVFLDGVPIGNTQSLHKPHPVAAGEHVVELRNADADLDLKTTIHVVAGKSLVLDADGDAKTMRPHVE